MDSDIPDIELFCSRRNMEKTGNSLRMVMGPPQREVDVLRRTVDLLTERLPQSWSPTVRENVRIDGRTIDAVIDLLAPDGSRVAIVVEAKMRLETGATPGVVQQVNSLAALVARDGRDVVPLVVARYLSPPTRDRLRDAGVAYADATGNILLRFDSPSLFVRDVGADRDPWRGPGRPRGTLKGVTAARLVRALADFKPPYSVPELAAKSGASVGATYRMVEFLEREGLIAREPRAPIAEVDWRGIIERWGEDLGVTQTEQMTLYLEPRGIPALLTKLQTAGDLRYVLTGTLAARYYDEIVPPRLAVIYADPMERIVEALGLQPSPAGNVLIGVPINPVVFDRPKQQASPKVAAPSQVAVDLMGGPGRGPSEAAMLLDWMERNEDVWRR